MNGDWLDILKEAHRHECITHLLYSGWPNLDSAGIEELIQKIVTESRNFFEVSHTWINVHIMILLEMSRSKWFH